MHLVVRPGGSRCTPTYTGALLAEPASWGGQVDAAAGKQASQAGESS